MKRIISRLVSLLFCFGAYALAEETEEKRTDSTGDYEYVLLEDGSTEIIRYTGTVEHLKIPAELDGYPVTSIGDDAFRNYSFPDILDDEFSNCDNLTSVNLPNSVTSIGDHAFSGWDSLTSINLPNSITCISGNPFCSCNHLRAIRVSPTHPFLATIDGVLFEKSTKTLLCHPCSLDNSTYAIPEGIISIGKSAFESCDKLTSVSLPDSITTIGDSAFAWCLSLTSINLPDSITTIDDRVFAFCSSLTSINLPNSVTCIGKGAFRFCHSLNNISLPNSVTSIGDAAFSCCRSLTSINLPDSITSIAEDAFSSCPKLVLTVGPDTFAEEYAEKNRIPYIYYESTDWLNS